MRAIVRFSVVAVTMCGCIGCDQASKSAARLYLGSGVPESFLHGIFRLQLAENPGAFLSLGASLPIELRFLFLSLAVGVVILGLLAAALFSRRLDFWRIMGLTMVAGGGTSNLIDRIVDHGRVTDFLNMGIGPLRTGIFNVADMAILAGTLLLFVPARPPSLSRR
jgi:signal peptidase II